MKMSKRGLSGWRTRLIGTVQRTAKRVLGQFRRIGPIIRDHKKEKSCSRKSEFSAVLAFIGIVVVLEGKVGMMVEKPRFASLDGRRGLRRGSREFIELEGVFNENHGND